MLDPYEVLSVARDASPDDIQGAFRAKVKALHPDTEGGGDPAAFRDLVQAYHTLRDAERRAAYDSGEAVPQLVADNKHKAALNYIRQEVDGFLNALKAPDGRGKMLLFADIIEVMRGNFNEKIEASKALLERIRRDIGVLADVVERLDAAPGSDNVIRRMVEAHMRGTEESVLPVEDTIATLCAAREIVNTHTFRADAMPKAVPVGDGSTFFRFPQQ